MVTVDNREHTKLNIMFKEFNNENDTLRFWNHNNQFDDLIKRFFPFVHRMGLLLLQYLEAWLSDACVRTYACNQI